MDKDSKKIVESGTCVPSSPESRMKDAGVRPTAVRILIYRFLEQSSKPLASIDIETALETVDRSTISRTLTTFLDHDLIHSIDDGSGSVKYEVCRNSSHSVSDLHVHFHCSACGQTVCLPSVPIPGVSLPDGYEPHSANFVITGLCSNCRKSSHSG